MASFLSLDAYGYRDTLGRFTRRANELETRKREAMRALGREMVAALQAEAPRKTGKFAKGLRYRTAARGPTTTLAFYASGEHAFLLDYIRQGTRKHTIPKGGATVQMAKGYPLRFYWPNGPRGAGIYRFWKVEHPGTPPNDFVQRVLDDKTPELRNAIRQVARRVVWLK